MWLLREIGLTFFRSAATYLHGPEARRNASRRPSRGSGGPANGTWSAAVKSWPALIDRKALAPHVLGLLLERRFSRSCDAGQLPRQTCCNFRCVATRLSEAHLVRWR